MPTTKTCDRCRSPFTPGSNRARYCSPTCRRAARTEYEEARKTSAYAGARLDPEARLGVPEHDAREHLTDADGSPSYGVSAGDRAAYLAARDDYLATLAATRRRYGMTRTADGWTMPPPPGHPCEACPIMRLPMLPGVVEEIERAADRARVREIVEASL